MAAALPLCACSSFTHGQHAAPAAVAAPATEVDTSTAAAPQTVTEAVGEEPGDTTTVISDATNVVSPTSPKSYTVKRGDTLWAIANMFLRSPWLWPEIWYVNPQIGNPHRIYPGDTVRLANGSDGRTQLQIVRGEGTATHLHPLLRSAPLEGPIATLPYSLIASFLSRPGVLSKDEVKHAPYVMALRDDHIIAGSGYELYVKKLDAEAGARYSVMHVDSPLRDPQSGDTLGYVSIYTGTAEVTRPGNTAKVMLTDSARETLRGDVLIAADTAQSQDFVPHAPAGKVDGRVIAVVNNVLVAGQYDVIALNLGTRDGLERGHILTVDEAPRTEPDRCARIDGASSCGWSLRQQTLPTESAGTLLVFKTSERMSYALIMNETSPIHVGDHVRTP
ncbi:MAG: LysM peptidoglycan-binding domain-containing protein [Steroidobacterales bacterium]